MIYHRDERMMDIIKRSGSAELFPAARYIMQLENIKESASILVNKVNSVEFPFKYTGMDRPDDAVFGAEYLVRAIAEEQIQAEERFREMLVRVFKITRDMQKEVESLKEVLRHMCTFVYHKGGTAVGNSLSRKRFSVNWMPI